MHFSSLISRDSIYRFLQECIKQKDLRSGNHAYSLIIRIGFDSIVIFSDLLIRLFAICGKLQESNHVFHKIQNPSIHTWNAIIFAHSLDVNTSVKSLQLYLKMKENGILPNRYVFLSIIKLCASSMNLEYGSFIHKEVRKTGFLEDLLVANTLIDMYVKCLSLDDARLVFDELICRDSISWSIMISGYANSGETSLAVQFFIDMQLEGVMPNNVAFVCIIKICPNIDVVRLIHAQVIEGGFEPDTIITNVLIDIYAKFKHIVDARHVFDCCINRDIVSWGAMIASYVHHGQGFHSLQLFNTLLQQGWKPSNVIFSSILKACATLRDLQEGRWIHSQALSCGYKLDLVIGNTLIDMYAKCCSAHEAKVVFDGLVTRDDVSWGAMFSVHTEEQNGVACLDLLKKMEKEGARPNNVVYLSLLKACINLQDIAIGRDMHAHIVMKGLDADNVIGCTLIDMYAKCGYLNDAHEVFDTLSSQDSVAWCALIVGYAQTGHWCQVLKLLRKFQKTSMKPGSSMFLSVVKACDNIETIDYGRLLHGQIIYWGYESEMQLGNALINMYGNAGDVHDASKVFDNLSERNDISWVSMMAIYIDHGYAVLGLKHCAKMYQEGIKFDKVMFIYIMKAQGILGNLKEGRRLHHQSIINELESDVIMASALVDMYAKCGCLDDASGVFTMIPNQNMVSYGAMISAYVRNGKPHHALNLFDSMESSGIEPSEATYVCCLKACGMIDALDQGRVLHKELFVNEHMNVIIGSALIDMYAKCGEIDDACRVFDEMPEKNVVMWGLMISMYTDNGCGHRALELFDIMQQDHQLVPRKPTFLSVLKACSDVGALRNARLIHDEIIRREMDQEIVLENAVIDCYSRCGSMEEAHLVFDRVSEHDLVSWTALIVGYAHCADTIMLRKSLEDMQQEGVKLDELIFMNILVACRHSGLIEEACLYFRYMIETHDIVPTIDHYNCMIDILSRGGYMQEAEHLLQTMHLEPDIVAWRSLLTCCTNFENTGLSLQCFNEVSKRDPINGSAYALMSKVYMNNHSHDIESLHKIEVQMAPLCSSSKDRWVGSRNAFGIKDNSINTNQKTMKRKCESSILFFFFIFNVITWSLKRRFCFILKEILLVAFEISLSIKLFEL